MSNEYSTNLKYNRLLETKHLDIQEPLSKAYGPTHIVMRKGSTHMHVIEDENGNAYLMRFGVNRVKEIIMPILIEEFGCTIIDQYGLEYPDCLD